MSDIRTRPATPEYRDNWSRIFEKKEETDWKAPMGAIQLCDGLTVDPDVKNASLDILLRVGDGESFTVSIAKDPKSGDVFVNFFDDNERIETSFVLGQEGYSQRDANH